MNEEVTVKQKIGIELTTLDSFILDYPDILLIKMDVQGAELNILKAGIKR